MSAEYETLEPKKQPVGSEKLNNSHLQDDQKCMKSYLRDDFSNMLIDLCKKINFRVAIFIFLIGIFIFSDLFIDLFLNKFPDMVDGHETTTKGTLLQLLFISVGYIIIDILVQGNML